MFRTVGPIVFDTQQLRLALTQECRLWKRAFGAALDRRASADMDDIFSLVDGLTKRLQRPIKDLEDVRGTMAALREVSRLLIGCSVRKHKFIQPLINESTDKYLHALVPSHVHSLNLV